MTFASFQAKYPRWREWLEAAVSFVAMILVINLASRYIIIAQHRPGAVLPDPIHALVQPLDMRWVTFTLTYSTIIMTAVSLLRTPGLLSLAFKAYSITLLVRILALYLTPLDPSPGIIPLRDPLVESLATDGLVTRDLFFSGHTATLFLMSLCGGWSWLRKVSLCVTMIVGTLVTLQHVHYAVDVLAAPFFAFGCYHIALRLHGWIRSRIISGDPTQSTAR